MINRLKDLLFTNRGVKQTVIKNAVWLTVGQIGGRLFRATIIIYAARVLGAAEYGVFSYALSLAGFFTIFADLGISPLMTREISAVQGQPEKQAANFASAFWIKIFLLAITSILIIFAAPKFSKIEEVIVLLPFVAILVFFDNFRDFTFAYFKGVEKMEREAFLVVLMNITIALTGFIILNFYKTAGALLFSYVASVAVATVAAVYLIKNLVKGIFKYFNKKIAWRFIRDSWPLAFSGLFGIFMLNIDIVMLGWWRTPEEIGYYSASQRVVQILYVLPAILASAAFPAAARFVKQKEEEKARVLNEKSMAALYFIAIPLAIGGIVLASPIIEFLFGKAYLPATVSFQILIATLLINFPGAILSNLVMAHNKQKKLFWLVIIGSLSNIVFNAMFIPLFGIGGAAAATFISQFAYFGSGWLKIKQIENFYTLRHLKKIAASAVLMGIFSYAIEQSGVNVIINIILSAGIYFAILYLLKEKILDEIKELFGKIKG